MKRAVEFARRFDERLVEEVVPAAHGRALLTPSLPRVYYANHFPSISAPRRQRPS